MKVRGKSRRVLHTPRRNSASLGLVLAVVLVAAEAVVVAVIFLGGLVDLQQPLAEGRGRWVLPLRSGGLWAVKEVGLLAR